MDVAVSCLSRSWTNVTPLVVPFPWMAASTTCSTVLPDGTFRSVTRYTLGSKLSALGFWPGVLLRMTVDDLMDVVMGIGVGVGVGVGLTYLPARGNDSGPLARLNGLGANAARCAVLADGLALQLPLPSPCMLTDLIFRRNVRCDLLCLRPLL